MDFNKARIKVNVANARVNDIWCRLAADKRRMCAETINAGVSAAEIAGISGGRSVEYEWESGGEKGKRQITVFVNNNICTFSKLMVVANLFASIGVYCKVTAT
jgi:hypothetical protein